ncbi:5990_t:CDS:2 [Racocetra fulgida]|uniref:5990_t:CDS:1 n=1 Tax=Racocetra fulgida TaxID=60492 RepID=A0A9N9FLF2_9GLOM|nr:5990_t:CDS:2 [Racocetra fulgida]
MLTGNKELELVIVSCDTDLAQTSLETSLQWLSVETLRFICQGIGLSELGQKQEITFRLVKKCRTQIGLKDPANKSVDNAAEAYSKLAALGQSFMPSYEALVDKALVSGNMEYVCLARQVILERAYVVRVADKDG